MRVAEGEVEGHDRSRGRQTSLDLDPDAVVFGLLAHDLGADRDDVEHQAVVVGQLDRRDVGNDPGDVLRIVCDPNRREVGILGHPARRCDRHQHATLECHLGRVVRRGQAA